MGTYISQIFEDPVKAINFFMRKNVTIWCEPTFQSIWSGPLKGYEQYVHTDFLESLYDGGAVQQAVYLYTKGFLMVLLGMATAYAILERKNSVCSLFLVYTIGGFLFHFFWEAKSQYTYPYVFVLVIPVAYMVVRAQEKLRKLVTDKTNKD